MAPGGNHGPGAFTSGVPGALGARTSSMIDRAIIGLGGASGLARSDDGVEGGGDSSWAVVKIGGRGFAARRSAELILAGSKDAAAAFSQPGFRLSI